MSDNFGRVFEESKRCPPKRLKFLFTRAWDSCCRVGWDFYGMLFIKWRILSTTYLWLRGFESVLDCMATWIMWAWTLHFKSDYVLGLGLSFHVEPESEVFSPSLIIYIILGMVTSSWAICAVRLRSCNVAKARRIWSSRTVVLVVGC